MFTRVKKEKLTALESLQDFFAQDLTHVKDLLLLQIEGKDQLLQDVSNHILKSGGKKIRSILTLASCEIFRKNFFGSYALAGAVELIHTATLLHDDVIDNSTIRRNQKTANNIWSNQACILSGDFLFAKAFNLMVASNNLEILEILSLVSAKIAEGEIMQISSKNNLEQDLNTYQKIIEAKTGFLFAAACQVGSLVAGASKKQSDLLYNFGLNLGCAYQIIDDLLDYDINNQLKFGKTIGNDFLESKVTIPVMICYKQTHDHPIWQKTFKANYVNDQSCFLEIVELMEKNNIFDIVIKIAEDFANKAIENINQLNLDNKIVKMLSDLSKEFLYRKN